MVLEGLCALLATDDELELAGTASDGNAAVALAIASLPHVMLLDVMLPGISGLVAAERIQARAPGVRIIALTGSDDPLHLGRMLDVQLAGYALKRTSGKHLLRAIHVVAGGGVYMDPLLVGRLVDAHRKAPGGSASCRLTPREEAVARWLAKGYSNKEAAAGLHISVKTVETHRANLLRKLGVRGRVDLLRFAIHQGWLDDL